MFCRASTPYIVMVQEICMWLYSRLGVCVDLFQVFCDDVQPSEVFSCLKKHKSDPEMERRYLQRLAVYLLGSSPWQPLCVLLNVSQCEHQRRIQKKFALVILGPVLNKKHKIFCLIVMPKCFGNPLITRG